MRADVFDLKARDAVVDALAMRLRIDRDRIQVRSTRPARTASPPCEAAPKRAAGAAFAIDAEANGKPFRYYADDVAVVRCDEAAGLQPR